MGEKFWPIFYLVVLTANVFYFLKSALEGDWLFAFIHAVAAAVVAVALWLEEERQES